MKKINTDHLKELAETMDLIAQHQLDKASQIYYCVVKSVNNNQCTINFNNKQYTVPYYGGKPTPNKTYAIFLPHNNMNESFVIGDGKDGGGGGSGSGIAIQPDPPTDGELVWIDTDDPGTTHIIPEIDDTQESAVDTWSSQKIASEIAGVHKPQLLRINCYNYTLGTTVQLSQLPLRDSEYYVLAVFTFANINSMPLMPIIITIPAGTQDFKCTVAWDTSTNTLKTSGVVDIQILCVSE